LREEKKPKIPRKSWLSLSLAEIIEISKATAEEVLRKEAVRAIVDIDIWTDETLQVVIIPVLSEQRIEEEKEDRIARAISQSIVESLTPPKRPLVIWKQLSK
jgi:ribosomal protein S13